MLEIPLIYVLSFVDVLFWLKSLQSELLHGTVQIEGVGRHFEKFRMFIIFLPYILPRQDSSKTP